jgi:hypothetical protein
LDPIATYGEDRVLAAFGPDVEKSASSRARRIPRHGHGVLTPFNKGEGQRPGYQKPLTMIETLQLARKHSPDAMRTLIRNLDHEDGRISTMAASLILERAWGKPREAKPEEQHEARIDLTQLTRAELDILLHLVQSDRLREAPVADPPLEIEGRADTQNE